MHPERAAKGHAPQREQGTPKGALKQLGAAVDGLNRQRALQRIVHPAHSGIHLQEGLPAAHVAPAPS